MRRDKATVIVSFMLGALALLLVGHAWSRAYKGGEMATNQLVVSLREAVLESGSPDAPRVRELQTALKERGDTQTADLAALLEDPDMRVSEAAADVLQEIASERASDALVAYALRHLEDPTGKSKEHGPGWQRLLDLGKAALPAMARAYAGQSPDTRLSMIYIAQQIGDPAGRPLLEAALAEHDSYLVQAAAEALGSLGDPAAYDRLVQLLRSGDAQQRMGAVTGLELLGDPAAVGPLLDVLRTEDQVAAEWGASPRAAPETLHQAVARVIDSLTGERFGGDVARIQAWLDQHRRP